MAAGAVSFRYVVLGFLAMQPMSGYDIKRFLAGLSWLTGSPSGGSLYPVLRARLSAHLRERRAQVAAHHELLAGGLEIPGAGPNLGQQLAVDYGLALATAELEWLHATLNRLPGRSLPEEAESHGAAPDL